MVGSEVDSGTKDLAAHPGGKVPEDLAGLRERLKYCLESGAGFAEQRGVVAVDGAQLPTAPFTSANAQALARYVASCREAGLADNCGVRKNACSPTGSGVRVPGRALGALARPRGKGACVE